MDENIPSEQLEEGEIVDDDFEDISDNSIIDSTFGKFVASNDNLRALSLSSDSETNITRNVKHKRKLLHRKSKIKHQKRRKKRRVLSDSSESDVAPPQDLKGKLKEAIHISGIEEAHKNPLEIRLKAMGGLTVNTLPPTVVTEPPPETIKESDSMKQNENDENSDKIDDNELENLRMEALKTAILNKFQRRKRKKPSLEGHEEATSGTLENKENDTPKDEPTSVKNSNEKVDTNNAIIDLEEDEDVLRASLLAGLAKKITKKQTPSEAFIKVKPVVTKLPVQIGPALPKRPINNFKRNIGNKRVIQTINRPKPQVKPLIINVNDDSDSEEDIKQKLSNPTPQKPIDVTQKVADLKAITSNVEKFLKEQRAKFETEFNKEMQIVKNKSKTNLEKSAVKLLPKSQQIEYQQLLKRLRNAEKKKKARRIALQKLKTVPVPDAPKINHLSVQVEAIGSVTPCDKYPPSSKIEVVIEPLAPVVEVKTPTEEITKSDSSYTSKGGRSSKDSDSEMRKSGITNELTALQKTLKEIKMQRNGSLQIKSKYQVLTPIIRKITATSNERKKQEHRIKNLLQELSEARKSLAESHERFSTLVKELVNKKEKIDKSSQESRTVDKKKENGNIAKQMITMHVDKRPEPHIEHNKKDAKFAPVTSTPIKTQIDVLTDETTISTFVTSSTNNDYEDMDVCSSDETDVQIDIVDPNDIDQIFKRKPLLKSTIPEYVSPLNFSAYDRYKHVDPLGIMCPYEVNGSCRDIDCTYKHYLKSHERL